MTKKEIAKLVYDNSELNQTQAQETVQATFDALIEVLLKYGRVELRGFGVFAVQTRAARKARNPRTGQEVDVAEHDTVVFKPSKIVKEKLEDKRAKKAAKKAAAKKPAPKASAKKPAAKKAAKKR